MLCFTYSPLLKGTGQKFLGHQQNHSTWQHGTPSRRRQSRAARKAHIHDWRGPRSPHSRRTLFTGCTGSNAP
jgi:hypothetical protein